LAQAYEARVLGFCLWHFATQKGMRIAVEYKKPPKEKNASEGLP
jgi:hypothetical protein